MKYYLMQTNTLILLLLIGLTIMSWYLGVSQASNVVELHGGGVMLLMAFLKVHFVMRYFMEVGWAPKALRWSCGLWVVLACFAIVASYLGLFTAAI